MKKLEDISKLLVVVDMINGFVKEGALADPFIGKRITEENEMLIKDFLRMKSSEVAFIRDAHDSEYCSEFNKFPTHCVRGTWESELIDELKIYERYAKTYKKNSRSTMYALGFMNDLEKMKKLREVVITGCCTDLCVLDLALPLVNYFDAYNKNVQVIVPQDAVETYDAPNHKRDEYNEISFKLMKQEGIKLVKTYGGNR